ncbi:MAG: hypothetical protein HY318_17740 [Armatimonadetes bacterium]|nr:hypothetical protein [Armatimonadota bacterium]
MGKICLPYEKNRCCVVVTVANMPTARGRVRETTRRLIADTGCPVELILAERLLQQMMVDTARPKASNFGWLTGYVVRILMPELGFDHRVCAYSNPRALRIASEEGFDGIAGKPFLDNFHYSNGEGGEFCLESWAQYRDRRGMGQSRS